MTKLGEGDLPPKPANLERHQKDLAVSTKKFQSAFQGYINNEESRERIRFKAIMDENLHLIQEAVREIKRSGIGKQESKLEADYRHFLEDNSEENISAVMQDLETLREYH